MTERYYYADENSNIHILTEEDLPKCPKTGGISPSITIIGEKEKNQSELTEHINCKCIVQYVESDVK